MSVLYSNPRKQLTNHKSTSRTHLVQKAFLSKGIVQSRL